MGFCRNDSREDKMYMQQGEEDGNRERRTAAVPSSRQEGTGKRGRGGLSQEYGKFAHKSRRETE